MRPDLMPKDFDKALSRVVEEAGEVLQVIGKIQRFGYWATDYPPGGEGKGVPYDNIEPLLEEMDQLEDAIREARRMVPINETQKGINFLKEKK